MHLRYLNLRSAYTFWKHLCLRSDRIVDFIRHCRQYFYRKYIVMGMTYAEIELINWSDLDRVKRFEIDNDEVRRMHSRLLVDTGAHMLTINETIQSILGLPVVEIRSTHLADGSWVKLPVVGPIEVRFANRRATCNAYVLPGESEAFLGAIPLEELDVIVHPLRQELIVNPEHPDGAAYRLPTLLPIDRIPWHILNRHLYPV